MKLSAFMMFTLFLLSMTACSSNETEDECQHRTCDELGINCGSPDDGCGNVLECGQCSGEEVCDQGTCVDNDGQCIPQDCAEQNITCGPATDLCGTTINCNDCPDGEYCESGQCKEGDCEPKTCDEQNIECGLATDLCGNDISCGTCDEEQFCSDGTCASEGQGTWTDPTTGLVWESPIRLSMNIQGERAANWPAANKYCKNLKTGGIENWRMPTIDELRTLVRRIASASTGGACLVSEDCANSKTCNDREAACNGCADENNDQIPDAIDYLDEGDCQLSGQDIKGGQCYWEEGLSGPCGAYWSSTKDTGNPQTPNYYYLRFNKGLIWSLWGIMDNFAVRCVYKTGE